MIESGKIDLVLEPEIKLSSTRPAHLGRIFNGKPAAEVVAQVKLLFSLCGQAHALAARQALGLPVSADQRRAVIIETLREHFIKIARDWRALNGFAPDITQLKSILHFAKQQPEATRAKFLLESLSASSDQILSDVSWIEAQRSDAARFLLRISERGWGRSGDVGLSDGSEATVLALCEDEPILQKLLQIYGRGLFTRHYARLVHCARLVEKLQRDDFEADEDVGRGVETSRGRLRHHASVEKGLTRDYLIMAPTDVNFSQDGPMVKTLEVIKKSGVSSGLDQAILLVEAYDPCVPYEIKVR